jgi:hypothetical protein
VAEADLEGKNAEFTTPPKIADLMAWANRHSELLRI